MRSLSYPLPCRRGYDAISAVPSLFLVSLPLGVRPTWCFPSLQFGSIPTLSLLTFAAISGAGLAVGSNVWLAAWTDADAKGEQTKYLIGYVTLGVVGAMAAAVQVRRRLPLQCGGGPCGSPKWVTSIKCKLICRHGKYAVVLRWSHGCSIAFICIPDGASHTLRSAGISASERSHAREASCLANVLL